MRGLFLDDIEVGAEFESPRRTITEADVVAFTTLTGITDPLFLDETFAVKQVHGSRVAPGPLALCYSIGLTEELVYGTTLSALAIESARFSAPLRFGDTIHVKTRVASVRASRSRPTTGIVVFEHRIVNQHDVVTGDFSRTMLIGTRAHFAEA